MAELGTEPQSKLWRLTGSGVLRPCSKSKLKLNSKKVELEHRRGKWGQLPPLEIFWPPWTTFAPSQTFILGHIWDKKRSGDFIWLILGQKHSVSREDLFFIFF